MPTNWMIRLVFEIVPTSGDIAKIVAAILDLEDAGEATLDSYEYAGIDGKIKGLMEALGLMGARPETIVEAVRQVRRERG